MNCPVDGTKLESHAFHSVTVDECSQCKGVWFDIGELSEAKDIAKPDAKWLDFDLWADPDGFEAEWSGRLCPVCGQHLATIIYGETGVTVDYCLEGHGIWLDQGEFEAIIAALGEELATTSVSEYVRTSLEEAKEIVAGDEGFISEWKDFLTVTRLLQYRILSENPRLAEILVALQATNPPK